MDARFHTASGRALNAVAGWLKDKPSGDAQIFRLFGYAGTGKTTLARHIADSADGKVLFAAFTGKAAQVMRDKGCHGASTIHSLIYRARESGEDDAELRTVGRRAGLQSASSSSSTNARWSTPSSAAT